MAYSLVSAPEKFISLHGTKEGATVDQPAYEAMEEQVTLRGLRNRPIAVGVAKLRLTFHNTGSHNSESMYREIDVFGSATRKDGERVLP